MGSAKAWSVEKHRSMGLGNGAALEVKPSELMRERAAVTVLYLPFICSILTL